MAQYKEDARSVASSTTAKTDGMANEAGLESRPLWEVETTPNCSVLLTGLQNNAIIVVREIKRFEFWPQLY